MILGAKIFNITGDPARQLFGRELRNQIDAALAAAQSLPVGLATDAVRADGADPRNYYTPSRRATVGHVPVIGAHIDSF
jgi:hypothetical protein